MPTMHPEPGFGAPNCGATRLSPTPDTSRQHLAHECQFGPVRRLVFDDVSCHSAGRDGQRTCKVHLAGTAAARKISVLCTDDHLVRPCGHPWPGVDAGSATRLDHLCASLLKDFQVTVVVAV